LQIFVVVTCQVPVVTRGNVSAMWQDNVTCGKCHCIDFNLVPIFISVFQFSSHFCIFGSILPPFFLIIEVYFFNSFFYKIKNN